MDTIPHLNWLAVTLAVAAFFVLGGIWFPLVVRRAYAIALGREMKAGALSLVGPLLCVTVITITDAVFIRLLEIRSYAGAAELGVMVGIGYLSPMVVNIAINPLFPRPFLYSAINAPYFIVGNALASLVLVAFG